MIIQEAVRLIQERDDGLSVRQKADLVVFFAKHENEANIYIGLEDDQLRQSVIEEWISQ
jgi:hypothetical protein